MNVVLWCWTFMPYLPCSRFIFSFVHRKCNSVTHGLACHSFLECKSKNWVSLFPNWLVNFVSRNFNN